MSDTNKFLQELWASKHSNVDVQTRVALKLDERDRSIAALEARCRVLDDALKIAGKIRSKDDANRIADLEAALREGAEYLHAFTPAGTPAVDAFIAKWSDRTALETSVNDCGLSDQEGK